MGIVGINCVISAIALIKHNVVPDVHARAIDADVA
jgi:hypothetical protein